MKFSKKKKFTVFEQMLFYYRFNLLNTKTNWYGTRACKKKYLKSPQWLRSQKVKNYPFWRFDKINWNIIKNGGWHFSYVMSNKNIINKIKSFAHSEYNKKQFLNLKTVKKIISEKKDIFNRPVKFDKIKNINKLPDYVIKNKKKFKLYMI